MSAPFIPSTVRSRWDTAVRRWTEIEAHYQSVKHDDRRVDLASAEALKSLDDLIENTPAPDLSALRMKVDLALGRADGFTEVIFDGAARAIVADILRLAEQGSSAPDPHPQWLADRNRLLAIVNQDGVDGQLLNDLTDMVAEFERRIDETPAATVLGWAAKAVAVFQCASEGYELSSDSAEARLREAHELLGLGHGGNPAALAVAA